MTLNLETIGLFIALIVTGVLFLWLLFRRRTGRVDVKEIRNKWHKIIALTEHRQEMNYKLAVIEADKLLDYVLQQMGFAGETTAERLKRATYKYPELKKVWWAHKVRNQLLHNHSYHLRYTVARKVLKLFKKALHTLRAL